MKTQRRKKVSRVAQHATALLSARALPVITVVLVMGLAQGAVGVDEVVPSGEVFTPEQIEFFEKQVRPLLAEHCFECHSHRTAQPKGGLRLDSRQAILRGGDTGPAAVPGEPSKSLLIDAINYGELYQMPPKSQLPQEKRAILRRWIEMGLPWPPERPADPNGPSPSHGDVVARAAHHWAWRPLVRPSLPEVRDQAWSRDPLDRFILARLEAAHLGPAPEAPPAEWLRRVSFDLVGLPPSPEELHELLANPSETSYERVVDRLLASPRFAERWARHWLDLVRYAESRGHEFDYDIPNAYEYRDYVIRALQQDVPYDQFLLEHIAGDLVEAPRLHPVYGWNESILGTGFWYLGEWVHSPVDIRKDECDRTDNMLDVFGKTFLALTVSCARCHEHKFDAISQRDYYALAGYIRSSTYRQVHFENMERNRLVAEKLAEWESRVHKSLNEQFAGLLAKNRSSIGKYLKNALAVYPRLYAAGNTASPTLAVANESGAASVSLESAARESELDPEQLKKWVDALRQAEGDEQHLLFPLILAVRQAADSVAAPAESLPAAIGQWAEKQRALVTERHAAWQKVFVVWDASQLSDTRWPVWMTDGFAYGSGPQRAGTWIVDCGPDTVRCATYAAARIRPVWRSLRRAEGVDGEPGRLAAWDRAGKVLRTATFELQPQPLHYLVRGSGLAYVVVDSHRMINGPLHGNLLLEFRTNGDRPQWVSHDLRRYAGHVAHVEFSPLGEEPLEILAVVQADTTPPWPLHSAGTLLAQKIAGCSPTSVDQLVACYLDLLADVEKHFRESEPDPSPAIGEIANWLLERFWLTKPGTQLPSEWKGILREDQLAFDQISSQIALAGRTAPAMWDGSGYDEHLLVRGNPKTPGELIPRGFLTALERHANGENLNRVQQGSGRLELARRLIDPTNPFVARVYVNRLWYHLMGRGIVASVDNFGVLGEPPSHPELLDYLASEFISCGWSTKAMIRRIVLSSTYRMSSKTPLADAAQRDPQNLLWHRMPVKRWEGETLRDSLLSLSGRLDTAMYGKSVPIFLTPFMEGRGRPAASGPLDGAGRRSIYLAVRRNFLSPMMLAFDTPQPFSTVGRRTVSNVPAQALILLNDPFVVEQARLWAQRLLAEHQQCDTVERFHQAIVRAYEQAFARTPTSDEIELAESFFSTQGQLYGISSEKARSDPLVWSDYCHVLWNTKEFLFVP